MNDQVSIITYQFSVVVKSLEKGLKDHDYEVKLLGDDPDAIRLSMDGIGVYIIYLPDNLADDLERVKRLIIICDLFKDLERHPLLIGAGNKRDDLEKAVPPLKNYLWIERPVDMAKLIKEVEREMLWLKESLSKKKVLIIDDDPLYASMICGWLGETYDMDRVESGAQAIAYLASNKVSLILLDYEMPIIDGPKILEMLKQDAVTSQIPVMFLTGIGTKESIARVMALKPQGYILKSASRKELQSTLDSFFEKQKYKI